MQFLSIIDSWQTGSTYTYNCIISASRESNNTCATWFWACPFSDGSRWPGVLDSPAWELWVEIFDVHGEVAVMADVENIDGKSKLCGQLNVEVLD